MGLRRGRTLADIQVVMDMHPRDLATIIDIWEEDAADARRAAG